MEPYEQMICAHCQRSCHFRKVSRRQRLCEACRETFQPVICQYCNIHFHLIDEKAGPTCPDCQEGLKHGKPRACETCLACCCFSGAKCRHCLSSEKKYGSPIPCTVCGKARAFDKPVGDAKSATRAGICALCSSLEYINKELAKERKRKRISPSDHEAVPPPPPPAGSTGVSKSNGLVDELRLEIDGLHRQLQTATAALSERDIQIAGLKGGHILQLATLEETHKQRLREKDELIRTLKDDLRALRANEAARAKSSPAGNTPVPLEKAASDTPASEIN
eukprot:m.70384 g.70384  ORF g.70384 m.70384 type:complete len:278 (+) comp7588_c0_seq3:2204-3037(+)